MLQDGACLAPNWENMSFSMISTLWRESVILEEVLPFGKTLISLIRKNSLETFCRTSARGAGGQALWSGGHRGRTDFCEKWICFRMVCSLAKRIWRRRMFHPRARVVATVQRVFGAKELVPNQNMRNSSFMVEGGSGEKMELWLTKILLLFQMWVKGNEKGQFSFVYNMECSQPRDILTMVMRCIRPRWSTDDDIDHTLEERCFGSGDQSLSADEWFGDELFCLIKDTTHMVREYFAVQPFNAQLV